jgi:serine protease
MDTACFRWGKAFWLRGLIGGLSLLMAGPPQAASAASPLRVPVPEVVQSRGFIVHLRQAAEHLPSEALATPKRQRALRAARHRSDTVWRSLLADPGLQGVTRWRLRDIGKDQQLLLPERALTLTEEAHWRNWLAQQPTVDWVVPNEREQRLQTTAPAPNDPLFAGLDQQWWLQPVSGRNSDALGARLRGVPGMQTAWTLSTGHADTVVAVLDTGITAHPDLDSSRWWPGYDMVSDWDSTLNRGYANDGDGRDADPTDPGDWVSAADQAADPTRYADCALQDSGWHGTLMAGVLAATTGNGLGVAGIDRASRLLPVRVAGKCGASVADIVDGMRWAAGLAVCQQWATGDNSGACAVWAPLNPHPARVINLSFGNAQACNSAYQTTIDELWQRGAVVVAAAGNQHAAPTRPANCDKVVGVAALNRDGFKANYSNFGSSLTVATVGGDDSSGLWGPLLGDGGVLTLNNSGTRTLGVAGYGRAVGTSLAAPVVSGTLALMLALDPTLSAEALVQGLRASARPHVGSPWLPACSALNPGRCVCSASACGAGILDTPQALAYVQALAQGGNYLAPAWPQESIDNAEVRAAVALGPDREGAATSTTTTATASSSGGGGSVSALALLALATLTLGLGLGAGRRGPQPAQACQRAPSGVASKR